jgi:GT2 family glycosyltransferase
MDTVSIVILSHNSRNHLEACLASVFAQDYPREHMQVIVVDNASSDGTVAWLSQAYSHLTCDANPENPGFARGIHRGAALASGTYLAFLNPDMRADAHWLGGLLETIQSAPDVACAGSVSLNWAGDTIDYAGRPRDALCLFPAEPADAGTLGPPRPDQPWLFASGGAMLIRRDVFEQLGGFDPDYFLYHEDVDFGWRLWAQGHRALRSAGSVVYHRQGSAAGRLAPPTVAHWVDKHVLYTVIKNLEEPGFQSIVPRLVHGLVRRANTWDLRHASVAAALRDCMREADALWAKRAALAARRVRHDAGIFAACGHPFEALLQDPAAAEFERYWTKQRGPGPCVDGPSLARYLLAVGFHAYAYNAEALGTELAAQHERVRSLVEHVGERQQAVNRLAADLAEQTARTNALLEHGIGVRHLKAVRSLRRAVGRTLTRWGLRRPAMPGAPAPRPVDPSKTNEADA